MAEFPLPSVAPLAGKALRMEFSGEKVRLLMGGTPLASAATDPAGWVTYTGTNGSGRVTAPLGATRFWITLAGGDPVGSREMIVSDKPKVTTRFTCDGSPVTAASPVVSNALTITRDLTLRARAYSAAAGESAEAQAAFAFTMPLLPAESYVSPADIDVPHATLDGTPAAVSVDGPFGSKAGIPIGGAYYLVRYPLSAAGPTPVTLHRSGLADVSAGIVWRAFELDAYGMPGEMTIRYGDSLLLTAGAGQTGTLDIAVTDSNGAPYRAHSGVAGQQFPTLFDQAGTFTAAAALNGAPAGSLVVTVVQVDMQGPIACQIGYRREKEALVYSPTNGVVFTANDGALLQVSVKEGTARGVRLYAKALTNGTPVIQARLGSAAGPLVARQEVDEFTLRSQATMFIVVVETFPDGSKLLQTYLEMAPKVEDLSVRMHIVAKGVTFDDSTLDMEVNTSDFAYDAASGKWLYAYRMIASDDFDAGSCHSLAIYQGGDQVGQ